MNDTYVDEAEFIDVEMPMYNLIEYMTIIIRILQEVYGSLKEIKIMQLAFIIFCLFEKNCKLIAADLSKQKTLDADSKAIQQIIFTGKVSARAVIYYIYEKSEETTLEFYEGTTKVLELYKRWIQ